MPPPQHETQFQSLLTALSMIGSAIAGGFLALLAAITTGKITLRTKKMESVTQETVARTTSTASVEVAEIQAVSAHEAEFNQKVFGLIKALETRLTATEGRLDEAEAALKIAYAERDNAVRIADKAESELQTFKTESTRQKKQITSLERRVRALTAQLKKLKATPVPEDPVTDGTE